MLSVLDQIIAGVHDDVAAREAKVPFCDIKAMSQSVPPPRDALGALSQRGCGVIAQIKRAIPGRGPIACESPLVLAQQFEQGGAQMIGCHTQSSHFQGSLQDLHEVKQAVSVPVMCRDFIVEPYQIHEARYYGADMVPLLACVLDQPRLVSLLDRIESLGMAALVEVHTSEDACRAIAAGARIVGVDTRNMYASEFAEISLALPAHTVRVALSGVKTMRDLLGFAGAGADAVAVGEGIIMAEDPMMACRSLVSAGQHPACLSVH